ncbi:MAG TPA: hypothetical protein VI542_04355 [Candidatus Tectomicrobia bacterium]
MWFIVSQIAEASSGGGGSAVGPIMEYIVSLIVTIVGGVVILAILFKGAQLLFSHERENFGGWVVGFLFGLALIAGSRPIAAGVTGFAGGVTVEMWQVVTVSEIAGYLLGDVLWGSIALGGWYLVGQKICQARHGA